MKIKEKSQKNRRKIRESEVKGFTDNTEKIQGKYREHKAGSLY